MRRITLSILALLLANGCQTPAPADANESRVIYLQHAKATDMASTLRDLGLPQGLEVHENAAANALLVSGDAKSVQQAMTLVTRLDQPAR